MKALVCYKWIKDEADIIVDHSQNTLNMEKAKYKISDIDRNALELGVTFNEQKGTEVVSLSVGEKVSSSTKDVLARGSEKAYYVETPKLDSYMVSKVIAEATTKIGDVDLILCGEGSGDNYSQQVAPRLAAILRYELVTYASHVEINGSEIIVERKLDGCKEIVSVQSPVVISVLSEINQPRIPSMKQILSARKKPAEEILLGDLGFSAEQLKDTVKITKVGPSIQNRKQIRINENGESAHDVAVKLVEILKENKTIN